MWYHIPKWQLREIPTSLVRLMGLYCVCPTSHSSLQGAGIGTSALEGGDGQPKTKLQLSNHLPLSKKSNALPYSLAPW